MLRVFVLGELTVEVDGRAVELPNAWRAGLVLAWLALHPGPHARAALAGRFWPDNLDARARAGLRNALWALRRAAGAELLDASRDRVGLDPAVWVDTVAFAEHVRGGRYAEAVALHRGELLSGIEEEWVQDAREAHRRQLGAAFEALAAGAEDAGDRRAAVRLARRRAELDPLDEAAHAALITRLAAAGDTVDALVCFERHREALRRELGIAPSHTTQEAVRRLRAVPEPAPQRAPSAEDEPSWRPGLPFPLPPRLRLRHAAPFVGRATELTVLRQAWRDVVDGAGPLVAVVDGEAGIGKSRLAREFALRTRDAAPAVVLQGTAQEEAIASLVPFVEAVGHLVRVTAPDELARVLGDRAADLAPMLPGLPDVLPAADRDLSVRRYQMLDAVAALLAAVSRRVPVLLILDDLHLADVATTTLLRHVVESRREARLLVVAACRADGVPDGGPLREVLHRLDRGDLLRRVPLGGIADADTAALAQGLVGRGLPAELLTAVHREADGNPLFVQELLRHLVETGSTGLLALSRAAVPTAAREVIGRRLAVLDDDCLRLLTIGAVLGHEFDLVPLADVAPLPEDAVILALDDATAAGLLVELPGPRERFTFTHALVRRALRDRISGAHRRRLHARIADALQQSGAELRDIAFHLCEAGPAGDVDAAVAFAERAADEAVRGLAHGEAVELYTRAMALLPADDPRRRLLALRRVLAYQALTHATVDQPRR